MQMKRFPRMVALAVVLLLFLVPLSCTALIFFDRVEQYAFPLHWLQGKVRVVSNQVIVGPYPSAERLRQLRAAGVTAVVTLLDRRLIYEGGLIDKERRDEESLGLRFFNFPMDSSEPPTSALNDTALSNLRAMLAAHTTGRVYVHCYLGKHRVGYAVAMLAAQAKEHAPRRAAAGAGSARVAATAPVALPVAPVGAAYLKR